MKKKVTKILSVLIAVAFTVLSVMMTMPVEAKAEPNYNNYGPYIEILADGRWAINILGQYNYQSEGNFTVDLGGDADLDVVANAVNYYQAGVTVHYPDGSTTEVPLSEGGRSVSWLLLRNFSSLGTSGTVTIHWVGTGKDLYFSRAIEQSSSHTHSFVWQTITEPTMYSDGLEGEVCSCGATRNTQPISAMGYALYQYAVPMINASKSGQTITLDLGEWNSFPKSFMEKIAAKSAQNVTFVLKYKWNHVKQEITIPAFANVDTSLDWYGPAKMAELYGAN